VRGAQYSDLTYRIYDYGRVDDRGPARELTRRESLEVMNFDAPGPAKMAPLHLPRELRHGGSEFPTSSVGIRCHQV